MILRSKKKPFNDEMKFLLITSWKPHASVFLTLGHGSEQNCFMVLVKLDWNALAPTNTVNAYM